MTARPPAARLTAGAEEKARALSADSSGGDRHRCSWENLRHHENYEQLWSLPKWQRHSDRSCRACTGRTVSPVLCSCICGRRCRPVTQSDPNDHGSKTKAILPVKLSGCHWAKNSADLKLSESCGLRAYTANGSETRCGRHLGSFVQQAVPSGEAAAHYQCLGGTFKLRVLAARSSHGSISSQNHRSMSSW